MACDIVIKIGEVEINASLNNSPTAKEIEKILPLESIVNTWGDEIYFTIPVSMPLDNTSRDVVEIGDIGYWPKGNAFCVFFGPTPISKPGEIRPASAVNIVGKVKDDIDLLKSVRDGETVRVEKKSDL